MLRSCWLRSLSLRRAFLAPLRAAFASGVLLGGTLALADEPVVVSLTNADEFAALYQPGTTAQPTVDPSAVVPEATLPEVEVRPPVAATTTDFVDPTGDFGQSLAFPSLADQILGGSPQDVGGLNSAIRGERSLFDQSNMSTIVDEELLREKMAPDMFRALQNEVGVLVQATGRGQASVFLRGVTGQQVLVLIDGVRQNNAVLRAGPNQYFNTVDPGQVDLSKALHGHKDIIGVLIRKGT